MKWVNKPVSFKIEDPDDAELYQFARSLPNFTAMVKQWLRSLRKEPLREFVRIDHSVDSNEMMDEVDSRQFL